MRKKTAKSAQDTKHLESASESAWLLVVFSLPAKRTSERVEVWRKLKKIGALPLGPAGYLLPHNRQNQEHFQWLAATIRGYRGEASVIEVRAIDDLPSAELVRRFNQVRARDYEEFLRKIAQQRRKKRPATTQIARLGQRLQEIMAIDFFNCALRARAEDLLLNLTRATDESKTSSAQKSEFQNRIWVTRPRPGIDRAASAWLIKRFIDPEARFAFSPHAESVREAVPFDMFEGKGFSHESDRCTFETLCKQFAIEDPKVMTIGQIVHDADLRDEKYGHAQGEAVDAIVAGLAAQFPDDETLLQRGMELFEGLYRGIR